MRVCSLMYCRLVIASINYMNLSTAQSEKRAKDGDHCRQLPCLFIVLYPCKSAERLYRKRQVFSAHPQDPCGITVQPFHLHDHLYDHHRLLLFRFYAFKNIIISRYGLFIEFKPQDPCYFSLTFKYFSVIVWSIPEASIFSIPVWISVSFLMVTLKVNFLPSQFLSL
ncbi:hypothetical protein SAMN05443550_109122 [Pedobacter hartonius]|uniref:Uncharacterized protein n=1 Tax=Pedobacter hartonius TaxID=425514 RepID=A0A1H4GB90_9SPHI|nr:hypothetical protein SAMN05443550_109122 [Pedobacter hartonius]